MNQNLKKRNFFAVLFLITAPLLGLSCASSERKTEAPPAVTSAPAATSTQEEAAPAATPVAASKKTAAARMVCDLNNDKRTVVYRMKGAGCEVTYIKFGHSRVVAENPDSTTHCDNVFDRLKQNLTAAGYACRETD